MEELLNEMVLVLNSNYEPLDVCRVKRAISLILQEKAETLETNGGVVRSATLELEIPSVIRLLYYVKDQD